MNATKSIIRGVVTATLLFPFLVSAAQAEWILQYDVDAKGQPINNSNINNLISSINRGCDVRVGICGADEQIIHIWNLDRQSVLTNADGQKVVIGVAASYATDGRLKKNSPGQPKDWETNVEIDAPGLSPFVLVFTTEGRQLSFSASVPYRPQNWRLGWFADC